MRTDVLSKCSASANRTSDLHMSYVSLTLCHAPVNGLSVLYTSCKSQCLLLSENHRPPYSVEVVTVTTRRIDDVAQSIDVAPSTTRRIDDVAQSIDVALFVYFVKSRAVKKPDVVSTYQLDQVFSLQIRCSPFFQLHQNLASSRFVSGYANWCSIQMQRFGKPHIWSSHELCILDIMSCAC